MQGSVPLKDEFVRNMLESFCPTMCFPGSACPGQAVHRHMCWKKRPLGHKQFNGKTVWIGKAYRPLHRYKGVCWRVCTGFETLQFSQLTSEDQTDFLHCSPNASATTGVFLFNLQRTRLAIHLESFCPATRTATQIVQQVKGTK